MVSQNVSKKRAIVSFLLNNTNNQSYIGSYICPVINISKASPILLLLLLNKFIA